ncbi:MAG: hypothetical protein VX756_09255 [Bacteroidota bacterium]|nr:hypothetical protein [Bacteroidota bacterium]
MNKIFNIFLVFAILFGPIIVLSQGYYNRYDYRRKRHEFTLGGGASNFLGELGGRDMVGSGFIYDLEFKETSYVGEFSYSYYALSKFSIRTNLAVGKVSGNDNLTTEYYRQNRNLNFESMIIEGALLFQVHLIKERTGNRYNLRSPAGRFLGMKNPVGIGLYAFSGIGGFYYNPVGQSPDGVKYKLKPLKTEGQGLPGGAEPYSGVSACIPVGFGIRKAFNGNGGIKLEASYRFTFTDYIDDVSTVYYNNDYLANNVSPIAAQMADPSLGATFFSDDGYGNTIGPLTHTETGYQRGDSSDNDGYMFVTLSAYRQLNNAARGYRTIRINQRRRIKASF